MGGLGLDGTGGGEGEEELAGLLETMMGQLMSKDILYEPLKELSEKVRACVANFHQLIVVFSVSPLLGESTGSNHP